MGAGYQVAADGKVTETYWEKIEGENDAKQDKDMKPYRIELVGVVCDAYLAVVRGIRYFLLPTLSGLYPQASYIFCNCSRHKGVCGKLGVGNLFDQLKMPRMGASKSTTLKGLFGN